MRVLIVLVLLLLLAAVWDFYREKIPNALIVVGCCYGIIRMLLVGEGLKFIPGILFPVIVLFPLYKIGVIGAGDIKLFSVLGFYFPLVKVLSCMFVAFLLGALVCVIFFIRNKNICERIAYFFSYLKDCICQGHFRYYYLDAKGKIISDSEYNKSKIHFAVPICTSVLLHVGGVF